jgi:hypothetical protein
MNISASALMPEENFDSSMRSVPSVLRVPLFQPASATTSRLGKSLQTYERDSETRA